jgi:hypothetical protein
MKARSARWLSEMGPASARARSQALDGSIGSIGNGLVVNIDRRWAIRDLPRITAGDSIPSPLALPYEKISTNINIADLIGAADAGRAPAAAIFSRPPEGRMIRGGMRE